MFSLIVYGLIAVAVVAAYAGWHHSIYASGAADQLKTDEVVVAAITKQRDDANTREKARETELGTLRQACQVQSAAVDATAAVGAAIKASSADINRKHASESAVVRAEISDLRALVAATPKGDRNAQCDVADSVAARTLGRLRDGAADSGNVDANRPDQRPDAGPVPRPEGRPAVDAAPAR